MDGFSAPRMKIKLATNDEEKRLKYLISQDKLALNRTLMEKMQEERSLAPERKSRKSAAVPLLVRNSIVPRSSSNEPQRKSILQGKPKSGRSSKLMKKLDFTKLQRASTPAQPSVKG